MGRNIHSVPTQPPHAPATANTIWNNTSSLPPNPAQSLFNPAAYSSTSTGQFQTPYSSHYTQAYIQSTTHGWPQTNTRGYALPSTSSVSGPSAELNHIGSSNWNGNTGTSTRNTSNYQLASWYQPGNCRCTYKGCSFSGAHGAVEIHMMDRHLIYPPGWEKRKKKDDWDTDPSLKGKPIVIHGTNFTLDSPEALEAWLAERRKRWPSSSRVDEKKRGLEVAAAQGQLSINDSGIFGRKKRRFNDDSDNHQARGSSRGWAGSGRRRGNARGRGTDAGWGGRGQRSAVNSQVRNDVSNKQLSTTAAPSVVKIVTDDDRYSDSSSSSEDDGSPEVVSSKPSQDVVTAEHSAGSALDLEANDEGRQLINIQQTVQPYRKPILQPKKPGRNPFASRTALFRNLLQPEIRVTVFNLSQAIHFLVNNDFLRGVEARPGEASGRMIEVLNSEPTHIYSPQKINEPLQIPHVADHS